MENPEGIFFGQSVCQQVMQIPGLIFGPGGHHQGRPGPAPGQIEEIDLENRGLKGAFAFANGGNHEPPPGGQVFYFIE